MSRRARAVVFCALVACDRRAPPAPPATAATPDASAAASTTLPETKPSIDATAPDARAATKDDDECGPRGAKITSARSIGHTSVVYKIELDRGGTYAWKVDAKKVKDRWRGEVAAYRLSRALGISNVPPACPRAFPREAVAAVSGAAAGELIPSAADPGAVDGALIPWIKGLQFLAMEKEPLRSQARAWLRDRATPLPPDKAQLAAQLSTMVVFDAVAGHWDRYSGGNVGLDETGQKVLFIDNDSTFMTQPPLERLRENADALARTERFSRAVYASLRALDDEARLRDTFGSGPDGSPLLPAAVVTMVRERARAAAAVIAKKIGERSEADVLVFP